MNARQIRNATRLPIQTEGTAARATWLAARELAALAELLKEQANDLSLRAEQPSVNWGDAGTAQNLAHDALKLVARHFYAQAGNSEVEAEKLVDRAVSDKIARM